MISLAAISQKLSIACPLRQLPSGAGGPRRLEGIGRGDGVLRVVSSLVALDDEAMAAELRAAVERSVSGTALVVGLNPDTGELRLWMRGGDGERARWWGMAGADDRMTRTVEAALHELREPEELVAHLLEALGRRDVGRAFFGELRQQMERVNAAWVGPATDDHARRQRLTLQLVCRLMFLRFVEPKGWFGGDPLFVVRLVLEPGVEGRYAQRLRPFFFDALNRPVDERRSGPLFAGIPFLNGGLFAPSPDEQACDPDLPDAALEALMERVFVRYRFVTDEGVRDSHAIDPRMLGTVFERLMDGEQRSRTGTWYTPPALVQRVVRDVVRGVLEQRMGAEPARRVIDGGALEADEAGGALEAVEGMTLLDPACGSGAFLLGALELLSGLRVRLGALAGRPVSEEAARRGVLTTNLWGIDLSATAVSLAELRLWLGLAAVMRRGAVEVAPLPSLGHRICHGDALFTPMGRVAGVPVVIDGSLLGRHSALSAELGAANGRQRHGVQQQMEALEHDLAVALQAGLEQAAQQRLDTLDAQGELFGRSGRAAQSKQDAVAALRALIKGAERDRGARHAVGFDPRIRFAHVMGRGGFDGVIGNPPWVRPRALSTAQRAALRRRFVCMAPGNARWGGQPDLSVAFVERALELTRPGGVVGLVVPTKLFTSGYGSTLRHWLLAEHTLVGVEDVSHDGGFGAQVFPGVLRVRRGRSGSVAVEVRVGDTATRRIEPAALVGQGDRGAPWLVRHEERQLEVETGGRAVRLGDVVVPRLCVKTGCNAAFVDPAIESDLVVPLVRGSDVRAFGLRSEGRLLFGHDRVSGEPLRSLEAAAEEWLGRWSDRLERRVDGQGDWPHWGLFRVRSAGLGHRVVWRDLAPRLEAVALEPVAEGGPVALNTLYGVEVGSRRAALRLALWLNAGLSRQTAVAGSDPALSGYRRFRAAQVGRVWLSPWVLDPPTDRDALDGLVERALETGTSDAVQEALDGLVSTWVAE